MPSSMGRVQRGNVAISGCLLFNSTHRTRSVVSSRSHPKYVDIGVMILRWTKHLLHVGRHT